MKVMLYLTLFGGGTSVVVADKLNRKWIGIDQSVQAVKVSEMRLVNQQSLFSEPFTVITSQI